jgi:hypothetical protein
MRFRACNLQIRNKTQGVFVPGTERSGYFRQVAHVGSRTPVSPRNPAILQIFTGLVFLKQSGTLMGVPGWLLTVILAILFFNTPPAIALSASWAGLLPSSGISPMVFFTILQVTTMDVTGAITRITACIRSVAAERYEQIMILNVGSGSFLVSRSASRPDRSSDKNTIINTVTC